MELIGDVYCDLCEKETDCVDILTPSCERMFLCQSCLERALAMVKGEDNVK